MNRTKINEEKRTKLREILDMISTDDEKNKDITSTKLNALYKYLKGFQEELKKDSEKLKEEFKINNLNNFQEIQNLKKKIKPADYSELIEVLENIKTGISNIKLQEKIDKDYSPSYKLMIDKLSSVDEKIGGWKFPQYAYTGIRDKSFSPINPRNNGIGIQDYDSLTYTSATTADTYRFYMNGITGTLVSTVVINYTDATKGTISNVIRT